MAWLQAYEFQLPKWLQEIAEVNIGLYNEETYQVILDFSICSTWQSFLNGTHSANPKAWDHIAQLNWSKLMGRSQKKLHITYQISGHTQPEGCRLVRCLVQMWFQGECIKGYRWWWTLDKSVCVGGMVVGASRWQCQQGREWAVVTLWLSVAATAAAVERTLL